METSYAIILSATITSVVTVGGWIYNNQRERKHEILKQKREHRLTMLRSISSILTETINKHEPFNLDKDQILIEKLETAMLDVQLYGYKDEYEAFQQYTDSINKQEVKKTQYYSTVLLWNIIPKIRKELNLPSIQQIK